MNQSNPLDDKRCRQILDSGSCHTKVLTEDVIFYSITLNNL